MERVGIEFYGKNIEELLSSVRTLQGLVTNISGRKYKMAFQLQSADIKRQISELQNKRIKLKFDISDLQNKLSSAKKYENELFKWLNANSAYSDTKAYRDTQQRYAMVGKESIALQQQIKSEQAAYEQLGRSLRVLGTDFNTLTAQQRAATMQQKLYESALNNLQGKVVRFGSRLQTLGKALQSVTSPFTRMFSGALYGIGYSALNKVTQGLTGAFERYDTMNTYANTLKAFGFDATKAEEAVKELEKSVLGLPTGLDEIVALQKIYVGASQDLEQSTKLAIATNNAWLASGTDSRQQLVVKRNFAALAGGADLASTSWDALRRAMPLAFQEMAKAMGYAKGEVGEFVQDLQKGNITGQQFLDTFIEVGTSGAIQEAANVMKLTFDALSANISNAMRRLGTGVIEALDDVFVGYNGRNFVQNLLGFDSKGNDLKDGIKDWIDDLGASIQSWVRANPDRILNFFETLKKIDIKGILKGVADIAIPVLENGAKLFSKIDGSKFAKMMIGGNLLGKAMTIFGGFVKGTGGITSLLALNAMGIHKKGGVLGVLANALVGVDTDKSAEIIGASGSAVGGIADIGQKAAGSVNGIKAAGNAVEGAAQVGSKVSMLATSWQGVASKAITIAAIPAIAGSILMIAKAFKEVSTTNFDIKHIQKFVGNGILALGEFALFAEALGFFLTSTPIGWAAAINEGVGVGVILALSGALVAVAESLHKIANTDIPSSTKIEAVEKSFERIIPSISNIVNSLSGNKGIIAGWTKKSEAKSAASIINSFKDIIDDFYDMTTSLEKISKAKGIKKNLKKAADVIGKLGEGLEPLKTAINKAFGSYQQNFVEQGWQETRKTFDETAVSEYETMTSSIARVLSNISTMLTNIQTLRDKINDVTKQFNKKGKQRKGFVDFAALRENLGAMIKELNLIIMGDGTTDNLYTLGQNAKWVKDNGIDNLSSAFNSIGEMIDHIQEVSRKASYAKTDSVTMKNVREAVTGISKTAELMVNVDTFPNADTLNDKIENVSNAIVQIGLLANKIRVAASLIGGGVQAELETINSFLSSIQFNGMQNLVGQISIEFQVNYGNTVELVLQSVLEQWEVIKMAVDNMIMTKERKVVVNLSPEINGVPTILAHIRGAHYEINEALRWTLRPIDRTVQINLSGNVNRTGLDALNAHTGGLIGNGVLYRAGGGNIFKPRGTDIVPAMLTPGEFVVNRRAVAAFGTRFMERVNSLDIAGAIRELHTKVGKNMTSAQRPVINNNNTDNRTYSNVQNINTNNPNFAFRRSRWVSELR